MMKDPMKGSMESTIVYWWHRDATSFTNYTGSWYFTHTVLAMSVSAMLLTLGNVAGLWVTVISPFVLYGWNNQETGKLCTVFWLGVRDRLDNTEMDKERKSYCFHLSGKLRDGKIDLSLIV